VVTTTQARAVGKVLTDSPLVRKFSFTGSTEVGKMLGAACVASTVKKISLELGGNAPLIVFADADLDVAVKGAIASKTMYYDEDLERKADRRTQILKTPVTDFELSVRSRNCLNKMNIKCLGDLVRQTEQELLSYKNFGETSLNEIKEILSSKNLRLGMAHEEAVASIEAASRPRATGENAEVLNKPVSDLDLSIRARRTVENLGCLTLGDIVQHTEDELLSMPNFGVTSLQELKRKLGEFGVKFADAK